MESGESTKPSDEPKGQPHRGVRRRRREGSGAHDSSKKFTKYFLIPLFVIGVLSIIGYLCYNPVLTRLRLWKSVRVVADAQSALDAGKDLEAFRKVQVALGLAPNSYAAQRVAARTYAKLGMPEALSFWRAAISSPNSSTDDRLTYIDHCLDLLRSDLAFAQLDLLESSMAKSPEFLKRVVRYYMIVGDYVAAVPYARDAQTADPKDEDLEFILAECLLRSSRPDWSEEGRRLMISIALTSGEKQFIAAQSLAQTGRLPVAEARQIARALEKRSDLTFQRRLAIASLRLMANDEERERMVYDFVGEAKPSDDAERIAFAQWALNSEAPKAAVRYLSTLESTNSELHSLTLEALARAEDWVGMDGFLERRKETLDPLLVSSLSGWRFFRTGDDAKAKAQFTASIDLALQSERRRMIQGLASISWWAARCGFYETAVAALTPLLSDSTQVAWAGTRCVGLHEKVDKISIIFPALRALRAYAPRDASAQLAFSYAALILNQDVPDALEAAREIRGKTKNPSDWKIVLLAFALARSGESAAALEMLDSWEGNLFEAVPKVQIMAAFIKQQAGQRAAARELALKVPRTGFKVEEIAILDSIQ
jgi:hypothetical protein